MKQQKTYKPTMLRALQDAQARDCGIDNTSWADYLPPIYYRTEAHDASVMDRLVATKARKRLDREARGRAWVMANS